MLMVRHGLPVVALFGCGKIHDFIVTFSCSQLHFQKQIAGTKRYYVDELHVKTRSHTLVQMMCVWYIYLQYAFILQNDCTKIQFNIWKFPKIVGFPSKSSILIGFFWFSIINHPFWGTTILGITHIIHQGSFGFFGLRMWLQEPGSGQCVC